ncbi:FAD-binding oxidoreductase [Novosphingobium umbonatum]|uniref:FAD-binding oxidoreductase n=1 Tax=Novosphingobium umbonatum TaxID=1908524 RepID=A0A437N1F9_9SPHN|nr:FAD-dependent oxidoreductase [Novosphingobium umbonatum]RVU03767.1 FAD-binding oxidoreductase [Novosphingobium umbonatum]
MKEHYDIAIIGAGMAGASLAAELSRLGTGSVVMLEAEDRAGYHATGRSAAFWQETYGGPVVQPLTSASGPELERLGFLRQRGGLHLAREGEVAALESFVAEFAACGVALEPLDRGAMAALVPGLDPQWVAGAWEASCRDIDVAGLHQHYLAQARKGGVELVCRAELAAARRECGVWALTLRDGRELRCGVLVNAAGAWADQVAVAAGAQPLGIQPLLRTMAQIRVTPQAQADLPLVMDVSGTFYFKPEAGRLWLTPHDERAVPPCDAAPEELDVAIAIDRFEQVVDWQVERVEHSWAGLRSFAPDRVPAYGWDAHVPDFFWCAGQGGFGIQTAPAAAHMAARLLLGMEAGEVDPTPFDPKRFSR